MMKKFYRDSRDALLSCEPNLGKLQHFPTSGKTFEESDGNKFSCARERRIKSSEIFSLKLRKYLRCWILFIVSIIFLPDGENKYVWTWDSFREISQLQTTSWVVFTITMCLLLARGDRNCWKNVCSISLHEIIIDSKNKQIAWKIKLTWVSSSSRRSSWNRNKEINSVEGVEDL